MLGKADTAVRKGQGFCPHWAHWLSNGAEIHTYNHSKGGEIMEEPTAGKASPGLGFNMIPLI